MNEEEQDIIQLLVDLYQAFQDLEPMYEEEADGFMTHIGGALNMIMARPTMREFGDLFHDDHGDQMDLLRGKKKRATDFPTEGEDKKISLRNSNYPQFDYDYTLNIKENYPEVWELGGNIRGNEAFILWGRARDGEETEGVLDWIKEREAWAARHFENFRAAGVMAQAKWGVIGTLGESGMKEVLNEEKEE